MNIEKNSAKKARQHTVYKNKDGIRIPGTTTITGVMNKPALVNWANNLGLQGVKVREYVDDLASIGTLAHYLIQCHVENVTPDTSDYSENQISSAENCLIKFYSWLDQQRFTLIEAEMMLVSEEHQYGGQVDIYCILNDKPTLLDLKTSKGVYDDHFTQVGGGYAPLLVENGYPVEDVRIIRVGRTETEGFEDIRVPSIELHKERFLACLKLYGINKELSKKR